RHFVCEYGGEFGVVVREREQSAGDVEVAARQGESIDRGRIQDRDPVFQVGPFGRGDQPVDRVCNQRGQSRVVIRPAISREDAIVLALLRRVLDGLLLRRVGQDDRTIVDQRFQARTIGERKGQKPCRTPS